MHKKNDANSSTVNPLEAAKSLHSSAIESELLISLINSMADGVLATDERGKIVVYNGAALNILDSNKTLMGHDIGTVCVLVDRNNQRIDITDYITSVNTQQTSRDVRLKYADGSLINLYISVAPVKLGYGQKGTRGFVMLFRDITHEKSLEEERDEFISVVSHELRTPIAIAEGNVSNAEYIVNKADGSTAIKQALAQAHAQIIFLSGMVNDLATLSRAERGKLTLEIDKINPHHLIEELAEAYGADASKKGLDIKTRLDPNLEILSSSAVYVREVLQNFITNAIKYTEKGSITLAAKQKSKGVLIEISDTGIGISKGDRERVFDKFFRSEDYRTRANNGTGLGLYVTMKLSRIIHAEIELESELNKGSTFSIFIPNLK